MMQLTFADAEFAGKEKKTRKDRFLTEVGNVVPWDALIRPIAPFCPEAGDGRRSYLLPIKLRVHLIQNRLSLSNPAKDDALYEMQEFRRFAGLSTLESIQGEAMALNVRHLIKAKNVGINSQH